MQQLPKLSSDIIHILKDSKNLLAFSAGSDSSALFFMLQALHVDFDVAIVNYQTREQSFDEETYAKELAAKYNKKCFVHKCSLEANNFEHQARNERYTFFEKTIQQNSYDTLLTAHHLNDKLEWFLMQLARGAGLVEMIGMSENEQRSGYNIIRPLLHVSKADIENFLHVNNIKHYIDNSNRDKKYFRNKIREEYASSFLSEFGSGVKKSFNYLEKDAKLLTSSSVTQIKNLFILEKSKDDLVDIRGIDKAVKKLGYLLSASQREEIIRTKDCIISDKIAICYSEDKIYIAPHISEVMDKKFKESCRLAKIPAKIRPYMYKEKIEVIH